MARQEARLIIGGVRFINQELLKILPQRTLEAIKGQRRKAEYKAMVQQLIQSMSSLETVPAARTPMDETFVQLDDPSNQNRIAEAPGDLSSEVLRDSVVEYLRKLPPSKYKGLDCPRLDSIINSLGSWDCTRISEEISIYLRESFPVRRRASKSKTPATLPPQSRRKLRRADYARVQKAWKRNRAGCIRGLLRDRTTTSAPPQEVMVPFWERIMTSKSTESPGIAASGDVIVELWAPISVDEVRSALPPLGTAPGPDGVTAQDFRDVPSGIWARVFNILLVSGRLPSHLLESRTTLIPKKDGASEPGDFRPITVSSTITRAFHKILANRLSKYISLDKRQRAFRPIDGCSENIFLMDFILKYSRQQHQPLYMASLDIAKAFDSVSHQAILDTLRTAGVPGLMVEYIAETYRQSSTRLQSEGWLSHAIHPSCGVKQGDPLSPVIFNMVIDRLFASLPKEVGIRIGGSVINSIAYADDIALFALTPEGLQSMLDTAATFLRECGLNVNATKCFTVALKTVAGRKKTVIDAGVSFSCSGTKIPALKRTDDWKYLGVPFTPEGRLMSDPLDRLKRDINTLSRAPLKPQQRLFTLRTVVIPSLYHLLVLGSTNISKLNKLDVLVRRTCRKWLDLPHDTPNPYFHCDVSEGGLSIPSLRWTVPIQRYNRLGALRLLEDTGGPPAMKRFLDLETKRAHLRLNDHGRAIDTLAKYKERFARLLHQSNDGRPLERSRDVMRQHHWVTDGNLFVSGRDYIHMNKLRINAIPLRSRMARGRVRDRQCRAGCSAAETLQHVLQQCHRTHDARIRRHNACLEHLLRRRQADGTVEVEPLFKTHSGVLKPDALIRIGSHAVVVDAQIVGERVDLDRAHRSKIAKYASLESVIKTKYSVKRVLFTSLTLSSRGVWSKQSYECLVENGVMKSSDAKIISTRALIGGLHAINTFNRRTCVGRRTAA